MTEARRERIASEVLRESLEAVSLADLGERVLPHLERLLDASESFLYRCDDQGDPVAVAGTLADVSPRYYAHYRRLDLMQEALARGNDLLLRPSCLPVWDEYLGGPVYNEFLRDRNVHDYVHLRLRGAAHHAPGMVGLLLARAPRQPPMDRRDEIVVARLLPALEAVARRSGRVGDALRTRPVVEAMLEHDVPRLALDMHGRLLWASRRAEHRVEVGHDGRPAAPPALVTAARRLAAAHREGPCGAAPRTSIALPGPGTSASRAELWVTRTRTGAPFVVADLEIRGRSPALATVASRFGLTPAEADVLAALAAGLADKDIMARLHISRSTVRTHLARIFVKLGVRSRTEAALLAHGIRPDQA